MFPSERPHVLLIEVIVAKRFFPVSDPETNARSLVQVVEYGKLDQLEYLDI